MISTTNLRPRRASGAVLSLFLLTFTFLVTAPAVAKKKKSKDPEAVINGLVKNQAEETLRDVQVVVRSVAEGQFEATATTNKKGEFEVHVPNPDGNYVIHLTREGYSDFQAEVLLTENEIQSIDFKLLDRETGRQQEAIGAYNEGATAFSSGDKATAKNAFLRAQELNPELPEPLLGLADIYLEENQNAEAAEAAERFLVLRPGDEHVLRLAFEAYRRLGDQEKVEALRSQLADTGMAAGLAIQIFNEGAHATQAGELETAIARFHEALTLDPALVQAHAGLATVFYNQERYDEALQAALGVLAVDPQNAQGLRMRYLVHDARDDRDEVIEAFEAYSRVDQQGAVDVLYQRADLDFRDGQTDRAQEALLKILEIFPEMARAHYTLGLIYASSDTAKAKVHLEKFMALAPEDPDVSAAREMISYF